jgi:hypothetical protein
MGAIYVDAPAHATDSGPPKGIGSSTTHIQSCSPSTPNRFRRCNCHRREVQRRPTCPHSIDGSPADASSGFGSAGLFDQVRRVAKEKNESIATDELQSAKYDENVQIRLHNCPPMPTRPPILLRQFCCSMEFMEGFVQQHIESEWSWPQSIPMGHQAVSCCDCVTYFKSCRSRGRRGTTA